MKYMIPMSAFEFVLVNRMNMESVVYKLNLTLTLTTNYELKDDNLPSWLFLTKDEWILHKINSSDVGKRS